MNAALGQDIGSVREVYLNQIAVFPLKLHFSAKPLHMFPKSVFSYLIYICVFLQRDHLKIAQQFFQLVGGSASECGNIIV